MMAIRSVKRLRNALRRSREKGAITIVETLIAISIGAAALFTWAQFQSKALEADAAKAAGRNVATYARATAVWLADSPPAVAGTYGIADLQDCTDPNGARFLPCIYGANTVIGLASNDIGLPLSFGDLEIEVTLPPGGPRASVDIGVFRKGSDENGDGLPDSRPDLAAIAVQHAREETAPAVFGFFELELAREDPAGLVFDPSDSAYDQVEVDNLARVIAQAGAHIAAAPFLRTDGSNEMQAGIGFDNGATLTPVGNALEVGSAGGVSFDADVTMQAVVADNIETDRVEVTDTLTVNDPDGVRGAGFNRLDQSADIIRIDGDVVRLAARVDQNETDIAINAADIDDNSDDIETNAAAIAVNVADIETNVDDIATNAANIADAITAIEDLAPGQSPEVCSPTRAEVIAANPGQLSCGGTCYGCGYWKSTSYTHTYKTRNSATLACDTHSITIYSSCCLQSNGLCDKFCDLGVTKC